MAANNFDASSALNMAGQTVEEEANYESDAGDDFGSLFGDEDVEGEEETGNEHSSLFGDKNAEGDEEDRNDYSSLFGDEDAEDIDKPQDNEDGRDDENARGNEGAAIDESSVFRDGNLGDDDFGLLAEDGEYAGLMKEWAADENGNEDWQHADVVPSTNGVPANTSEGLQPGAPMAAPPMLSQPTGGASSTPTAPIPNSNVPLTMPDMPQSGESPLPREESTIPTAPASLPTKQNVPTQPAIPAANTARPHGFAVPPPQRTAPKPMAPTAWPGTPVQPAMSPISTAGAGRLRSPGMASNMATGPPSMSAQPMMQAVSPARPHGFVMPPPPHTAPQTTMSGVYQTGLGGSSAPPMAPFMASAPLTMATPTPPGFPFSSGARPNASNQTLAGLMSQGAIFPTSTGSGAGRKRKPTAAPEEAGGISMKKSKTGSSIAGAFQQSNRDSVTIKGDSTTAGHWAYDLDNETNVWVPNPQYSEVQKFLGLDKSNEQRLNAADDMVNAADSLVAQARANAPKPASTTPRQNVAPAPVYTGAPTRPNFTPAPPLAPRSVGTSPRQNFLPAPVYVGTFSHQLPYSVRPPSTEPVSAASHQNVAPGKAYTGPFIRDQSSLALPPAANSVGTSSPQRASRIQQRPLPATTSAPSLVSTPNRQQGTLRLPGAAAKVPVPNSQPTAPTDLAPAHASDPTPTPAADTPAQVTAPTIRPQGLHLPGFIAKIPASTKKTPPPADTPPAATPNAPTKKGKGKKRKSPEKEGEAPKVDYRKFKNAALSKTWHDADTSHFQLEGRTRHSNNTGTLGITSDGSSLHWIQSGARRPSVEISISNIASCEKHEKPGENHLKITVRPISKYTFKFIDDPHELNIDQFVQLLQAGMPQDMPSSQESTRRKASGTKSRKPSTVLSESNAPRDTVPDTGAPTRGTGWVDQRQLALSKPHTEAEMLESERDIVILRECWQRYGNGDWPPSLIKLTDTMDPKERAQMTKDTDPRDPLNHALQRKDDFLGLTDSTKFSNASSNVNKPLRQERLARYFVWEKFFLWRDSPYAADYLRIRDQVAAQRLPVTTPDWCKCGGDYVCTHHSFKNCHGIHPDWGMWPLDPKDRTLYE
ncbi:hypothetical protein CLAFUW4_08819 [Fulvia fulva]|nr:hypothetical protein CLAFUR4_08825 [Fulvia fulva]KAK4614768.1 hypothetical protein CLAFUR0_08817 [Fulvia fulva]WPV20424.1 hypothetical protein CLAFUW4_08819 [Fulvia fulva]WPV35261.1 hypothetical protein CLAFUW7_08820 [Fulvia fulva]